MKRFLTMASIVMMTIGVAACTREKPPVTEPPPTVPVAVATGAPTLSASGIVSPTVTVLSTSVAPASPEATNLPPGLPTQQPAAASTAAPTSALPAGAMGQASTYTVQWGDLLNKIAARFGITTQAIVAANPGLDPNRIYPGQVINIPAGSTQGTPPTPEGSTGTVPPSTLPNTYTVQRGDWFYAIARKFGISVAALQAANPGINSNNVYPGQVLNIPSGSSGGEAPSNPSSGNSYTVRAGDTLYSIAVRFGKTVYSLQIANHLPNPNAIYPGQTLVIP